MTVCRERLIKAYHARLVMLLGDHEAAGDGEEGAVAPAVGASSLSEADKASLDAAAQALAFSREEVRSVLRISTIGASCAAHMMWAHWCLLRAPFGGTAVGVPG